MEANKDPAKVLEKIGLDAYPGAEPVEGATSLVTMGGMTVANAVFTTDAAPDDVLAFYKEKLPGANVVESPEQKILSKAEAGRAVIVIIVKEGSKTKIQMSRTDKN